MMYVIIYEDRDSEIKSKTVDSYETTKEIRNIESSGCHFLRLLKDDDYQKLQSRKCRAKGWNHQN